MTGKKEPAFTARVHAETEKITDKGPGKAQRREHRCRSHSRSARRIIASQARIGLHDCLYVALAEREGCQLVTADDRLVRTLQPTFPFIKAFTSVP
jgi:hypothetical protein